MCGVVGYLGPSLGASAQDTRTHLERAANAIRHRGPDDGGFWQDADAGIALAHRRLCDSRPVTGRPPADGLVCDRWMLVFNGEIYNHLELRRRLERRSTTRGCSAAGGNAPVARPLRHRDLAGVLLAMGRRAHARVDRRHVRAGAVGSPGTASSTWRATGSVRSRSTTAGWASGFGFASELKALRALPGFDATIDRARWPPTWAATRCRDRRASSRHAQADAGLLARDQSRRNQHRRLPAPALVLETDRRRAQQTQAAPLSFESDQEATDALEGLLGEAVQSQMRRTCRSARSCPAASIRRPSWR